MNPKPQTLEEIVDTLLCQPHVEPPEDGMPNNGCCCTHCGHSIHHHNNDGTRCDLCDCTDFDH